MKKETKKAPIIRFRGFTDDWEQRKLGEIFTERSEKKHEYLPPLTIVQGRGTVRRDEMDRELIYDKSSLSNYKLVKKNDFIVHLRSFEGGLEKSNIEGIVSPAYHIFHSDKINTEFYYSFFRSNDFINHKLVPFVYGIRDGRSIDIAGMKTIKIPYPSVNEQNRIGTLICQLNSLVALHQRKLDQLKKLKKYFLQNMFPAKGEKVPRIRFKGFTDDWEQRKVTELGYIYIGLVTTMTSHYSNHGTLLIRNSDIKDSCFEFDKKPIFLDEEFAKQNASRRHQVGDVITVHTGDIGTSAVITEKEEGSIGFATIITRPYKEKITSEYLCTYLNTDTHKNFALNISTGDGRNNYNLKDYYECVVPVPRIKEQIKIADFINALNNLITLHQQKLNQLQTMKKFMLQNLFI